MYSNTHAMFIMKLQQYGQAELRITRSNDFYECLIVDASPPLTVAMKHLGNNYKTYITYFLIMQ